MLQNETIGGWILVFSKSWALSLHSPVYKHQTDQNTCSVNAEGQIIPEYVLESNSLYNTDGKERMQRNSLN